jgi:hypothetical protein
MSKPETLNVERGADSVQRTGSAHRIVLSKYPTAFCIRPNRSGWCYVFSGLRRHSFAIGAGPYHLAAWRDALQRLSPNDQSQTPPNCGIRTLKNPMAKKKTSTAVVSSELVRRCTWCGKQGARFHRRDASGTIHRFHADCWLKHCAFLQSPNTKGQARREKE